MLLLGSRGVIIEFGQDLGRIEPGNTREFPIMPQSFKTFYRAKPDSKPSLNALLDIFVSYNFCLK